MAQASEVGSRPAQRSRRRHPILQQPVVAAVYLLALLATGACLWQAVPAIRDTLDATRDARRESDADREIAPAYAVSLPPGVLRGAVRLLPRDARYTIVVGDTVPLPGVLGEAIRPLLVNYLLPRRYTGDVASADWVIAYGTPTETLGVPLRRQVEVDPGVVVAEVDR